MRQKRKTELKDEEYLVLKDRLVSISKELDKAVEVVEERLLGKHDSSSVKAVSGGRPESNRSKF